MRFFLDENFPKAAHVLLAGRGHDVMDVRGTSDEGMDDPHIFGLAQRNEAAFLTTDKDFFHTVPHLYSRHHGAVVIALRQPNRKSIMDRLDWFLSRFSADSLQGRVFLLKDRTYVVYPGIDD